MENLEMEFKGIMSTCHKGNSPGISSPTEHACALCAAVEMLDNHTNFSPPQSAGALRADPIERLFCSLERRTTGCRPPRTLLRRTAGRGGPGELAEGWRWQRLTKAHITFDEKQKIGNIMNFLN